MNRNDYYRVIPKVDRILELHAVRELCETLGKGVVTDAVRHEVDTLRSLICIGEEAEIQHALEVFEEELPQKIQDSVTLPLKKVWNATGIILHTNIGRAPLGKRQIEAAIQAMAGYSNLEYNLDTGNRGKRRDHFAHLAARVTGCESATAVNNNAAAVTLMLSALTRGKEVLVSRGELIEIGGKFRIPDVMEQSGAVLREVGTTNRTRVSDYESAITENTGAIMKVHTSNYKILGFTEETSVEELVELGKKYHLPVLVDLGSGVLVNLENFGLTHEPTVQETIRKGADLVCFSGDKLLGGPQAGIIAGKQEYIAQMETHPLMRTFRLDKCTIAALAATFQEYLDEARAVQNIPVLAMLARTEEELKEQAEKLYSLLKQGGFPAGLLVEKSVTMMGGGSLPGEKIPGYAVTMKLPKEPGQAEKRVFVSAAENDLTAGDEARGRQCHDRCEEMTDRMRRLPVPVIAHVKNEKIWLEMRTIPSEETEALSKELLEAFGKNGS